MNDRTIRTTRITTAAAREAALDVIRAVYLHEKGWLAPGAVEAEIDASFASEGPVSWFLVEAGPRPVGVLRLTYNPPLEIPAELEVELEPGVDLVATAARGRFAEIGRFMIVPDRRRSIQLAMALMKAAVAEAVARGTTHFLTDVFEDDPHSPLGFHTRVLGFTRIGTHRYGELACASRRIILVLDLVGAYRRLKAKKNRIFRSILADLAPSFEALTLPRVA